MVGWLEGMDLKTIKQGWYNIISDKYASLLLLLIMIVSFLGHADIFVFKLSRAAIVLLWTMIVLMYLFGYRIGYLDGENK